MTSASEDEFRISANFQNENATLSSKIILDGSYETRKPSVVRLNAEKSGHSVKSLKQTSYFETLTHMIKGNIGCGILATGAAFKNGGLLFSTILVFFLGFIACYNQYVLITMANTYTHQFNLSSISFSETVGIAFDQGSKSFKKLSKLIRLAIKSFIILTQLGFCSIYFLFISQSLNQVLSCYDININMHLLMLMVLPIIWITALITELKYIAPLSTLANLSIFTAFSLILYRSATNITASLANRRLIGDWDQLPLCFGVIIFALEGIGLIIPLQQNMKNKEHFLGPFGVLNLSLGFVTTLIAMIGFLGYYKYGDEVKESLTLNLNAEDSWLTQIVIMCMMLGILCTYALQFFIPVLYILPDCNDWISKHHKIKFEHLIRSVLVICTFLVAELIPHLDLFVSLIGAIGGTFLALIFTPLADIANRKNRKDGVLKWRLVLDGISLIIGFFGFFIGTVMSMKEIIYAIKYNLNMDKD